MTNPVSLLTDAVEALRQGNKIEAIKRVRMATGLGLAEAKALVDAYESKIPSAQKSPSAAKPPSAPTTKPAPTVRPRTGLSPGEVPPSSPGTWLALVLAVVVAMILGVYFLR